MSNYTSMWWYNHGPKNFGDWLGPWIAEQITGIYPELKHATKSEAAVYSVGSILEQMHEGGIVWGTGIIAFNNQPKKFKTPKKICSVRGPISRKALLDAGIDCPEVYGDAALILPELLKQTTIHSKKYKLGIIPHFMDYNSLKTSNAKTDKNVLIVDVITTDFVNLVKQILECECIVSSSLHGVILSVAYGIPTRWILFSDKSFGNGSKFWDFWFSLLPKNKHDEAIKDLFAIIDNGNLLNFDWEKDIEKFNFGPEYLLKFLPIVHKQNDVSLNTDYLIKACIKYEICDTLIEDIHNSCPYK